MTEEGEPDNTEGDASKTGKGELDAKEVLSRFRSFRTKLVKPGDSDDVGSATGDKRPILLFFPLSKQALGCVSGCVCLVCVLLGLLFATAFFAAFFLGLGFPPLPLPLPRPLPPTFPSWKPWLSLDSPLDWLSSGSFLVTLTSTEGDVEVGFSGEEDETRRGDDIGEGGDRDETTNGNGNDGDGDADEDGDASTENDEAEDDEDAADEDNEEVDDEYDADVEETDAEEHIHDPVGSSSISSIPVCPASSSIWQPSSCWASASLASGSTRLTSSPGILSIPFPSIISSPFWTPCCSGSPTLLFIC